MDTVIKHKIAISPSTFVWRKGATGLMYDSNSHKHLIFGFDSPLISSLYKDLMNPANLYVLNSI